MFAYIFIYLLYLNRNNKQGQQLYGTLMIYAYFGYFINQLIPFMA